MYDHTRQLEPLLPALVRREPLFEKAHRLQALAGAAKSRARGPVMQALAQLRGLAHSQPRYYALLAKPGE